MSNADNPALEGDFFIKPATPVPAQKTVLPPCDQIGVTIIIPRVCCFKRDTATLTEERLVEALKVAIAGAIAEYPHLCGKITYANEKTHRFQLEIPEDTTVQLRVKNQPHLDADELEKHHWPIHKLKRAELCLSKYPTRGINTYNFAVQANLIKGGLLLLTHMNHIHFDGIGHVMIELVLAHHLGRALDGKPPKPSGVISEKALDKSLAYAKHPARPILDWPDWRPAGPPLQLPGMSDDELMEMVINASSDFTITLWHFTPEIQQELRALAQVQGGKKISLASSMHAWLWRMYVKVREHEPDVKSTCFTPVQTRGRVPELPQMWSGSALVYSRAEATAEEVKTLPLNELGNRIERGTARWNADTIREYWGSIEDVPDLATIEPNVNRIRGTDVEFSNVTTFPFHTLRWGKGLTASGWRCTELAFSDAYVLLAPKLPNGSIEVLMLWTEDCLENALKDPEWKKYAKFACAGEPGLDERLAAEWGRVPPPAPRESSAKPASKL